MVLPTIFYRLGRKFGAKFDGNPERNTAQFVEYIQAQAELLLFNASDNLKTTISNNRKKLVAISTKRGTVIRIVQCDFAFLFINGLMIVCTLWMAAATPMGNDEFKLALIALVTFSSVSLV